MVEPIIDLAVLVPALLHVPSRQPILDFSVGPRVLLEDHDQRAALGENPRDFRAGGGGADHAITCRGVLFNISVISEVSD